MTIYQTASMLMYIFKQDSFEPIHKHKNPLIHSYVYIYIYIYICMHTHTYI